MTSHTESTHLMIDAWKFMVGRLPGSTIEHSSGLASTFAHVPLVFFNVSLPDRPTPTTAEFEALLALSKARAASCAHGTLLCVCDAWAPENWRDQASTHGLSPLMDLTGMSAPSLLPPTRPLPALDIRRVADLPTATQLANINALAYGMPTELFSCMWNLHLWTEDNFGYVAYVEGQAVSTATVFLVSGILYIALVATLPGHQGKGYAEAVLRHAAEQAAAFHGPHRLVLHASDMGRPVYQRMGFSGDSKIVILSA